MQNSKAPVFTTPSPVEELSVYDQLIIDLGGATRAAEFLGVSRQVIYKWREPGFLTAERAAWLQIKTDGKVKARDLVDNF